VSAQLTATAPLAAVKTVAPTPAPNA